VFQVYRETLRVAARPVFAAHHARVTFCASRLHTAFPGWRRQNRLLDLIAETGGTAVFTGHDLRSKKYRPGVYSTQARIGRLLEAAPSSGVTLKPA